MTLEGNSSPNKKIALEIVKMTMDKIPGDKLDKDDISKLYSITLHRLEAVDVYSLTNGDRYFLDNRIAEVSVRVYDLSSKLKVIRWIVYINVLILIVSILLRVL